MYWSGSCSMFAQLFRATVLPYSTLVEHWKPRWGSGTQQKTPRPSGQHQHFSPPPPPLPTTSVYSYFSLILPAPTSTPNELPKSGNCSPLGPRWRALFVNHQHWSEGQQSLVFLDKGTVFLLLLRNMFPFSLAPSYSGETKMGMMGNVPLLESSLP